MKLKLLIVLLLATLSLYGQGQDSTSTIRTRTLRFLLQRHNYAMKLEKDIKAINQSTDSLKSIIRYQKVIIKKQSNENIILKLDKDAYKQASTLSHNMYLGEVKAHKKTIKKWRWKTGLVITTAIVLDAIIIYKALD